MTDKLPPPVLLTEKQARFVEALAEMFQLRRGFLFPQTPYSELGVATKTHEWQDSHRTWLDWGDRQCVAPLNDLGFPRAGPFFYVYPLFATCGGIQQASVARSFANANLP